MPITASGIPSVFPVIDHPFPPIYADSNFAKQTPVPTCSWISNLFYPSVNNIAPTTPDPYILRVLDGDSNWGVSISQPGQPIIGGYPAMNNVPATPAGYAINSAVIDFRISAKEWSSRPSPLVTQWDLLSAQLKLSSQSGSNIVFPITRGSAFITAQYQTLTPQFFTQHAIINVKADGNDVTTGQKFKITLNNGSTWLVYVLGKPITLKQTNMNLLVATEPYNGVIQVTKLPRPEDEATLDAYHGVWATGGKVTIDDGGANYRIDWIKQGDTNKDLLIYAYAHHLKTLTSAQKITNIILNSSSKGPMRAVIGNSWTLVESDLPAVDWFPQQPVPDTTTRNEILTTLADEIRNTNYTEHTITLDDTYFAGKGLQKLALLALILNKPQTTGLVNEELAELALSKLKAVMGPFLDNKVKGASFQYDKRYKGIVATSGLPTSMGGTGNRDAGFGHSYYNDHHYHQGYFIVTAAILNSLDPTWRSTDLKQWTEALIRDVNNPVQDEWFAQFRSWDWFAGHSWAGGIKVNGALDGRDQESVPEVTV
ncbi:endo-1,3(4)-beta-glucanase [Cokeromyces recurvatus]|uniref:endo-1,3(4)-beta-glucanase n=1 Tax=Cokeromyces recurvatus TaxID=90255 RepID=UPI0022206091|nr:endo-1,3(4)-beta-glucanase [Cokeromyces recurvatus]KAI7902925.1 endo-1,3(4)-beta-glucanase [Cokeromyces recurvatus]